MLATYLTFLALAAEPNYRPLPGDTKLKHAPAFVDSARLGDVNGKPALVIEGSLPTSCHQLRLDFTGKPDAKKRISGKAYAVADPKSVCAQMLQPFSAKVPLSKLKKGTYPVWINDQEMAKIQLP